MLIRTLTLAALLSIHTAANAFLDDDCSDELSSTYCAEISAKKTASRKEVVERIATEMKESVETAREQHKAALRLIQEAEQRKADTSRRISHGG